MNKWEEKRTRPVLPIYLAALVWPVGALLLPAYRLSNLLIIAGLSLAAYGLGTKFCPTRVIRKQVPYATGSEDVDTMLSGISANLDKIHALNDAIPDPELSAAMTRMEKKIIYWHIQNPAVPLQNLCFYWITTGRNFRFQKGTASAARCCCMMP